MAKAYTYSILNQVEDFLEVNLVFYHVKKNELVKRTATFTRYICGMQYPSNYSWKQKKLLKIQKRKHDKLIIAL